MKFSNKTKPETAATTMMKYILQSKDRSEQQTKREDPIDPFFLLSIANTVKKFSPLDQHLVKNNIFQMVSKWKANILCHNFHCKYKLIHNSKCVRSMIAAMRSHNLLTSENHHRIPVLHLVRRVLLYLQIIHQTMSNYKPFLCFIILSLEH